MTNSTTVNRPFLNRNIGVTINDNGGKKTYALMMGGFVAKDAEYRTAEGDKKSMLRCSIAVNGNPFALLGEEVAAAHASDPYTGEDKPFIQLVAFGKVADDYRDLKKGSKILVSGPLTVQTFKRKDGNDGAAVQVIANELIAVSCKAADGDNPKASVHCMTNLWKDKAGNEHAQKLALLTGTVKSSKEVSVTTTGRSVRNFTIELAMPATKVEAICNGSYTHKDTEYPKGRYVNLGRWGEAAKHLDKVLVPGNVVAVLATLTVREGDDGARYVNGTAMDIAVLRWANSTDTPAQAPAQAPASASAPSAAPEYMPAPEGIGDFVTIDEDDDLPF